MYRGQRRLRHPAFGFSVLHPGGGFRDSPDVARAMTSGRADPESQTYGFIDTDTQSVFVVSVQNGMGGTRDKLAEHIDGVARGIAGALPAGTAMQPDKRITWEDGRHLGRLSAAIAGDMHVEVASYSIEPPGRAPFIVNLMVTTRTPAKFANLLASFRP